MIGFYGDTPAQEHEAAQIMGILWQAYPGHPWFVRVYDQGFFIRHLAFPMNKPYGMNVKFKDISHDAAVMKHEIIMQAGEWLERAGIKRMRFDSDQDSGFVEGVPVDAQEPQPLEKVLVLPDGPIREEPHRAVT